MHAPIVKAILGCSLLAALGFAQTSYTEGIITIPGQIEPSVASGIDDDDQIAGTVYFPTGYEGFVLSNGVIGQIEPPSQLSTAVLGINSVKGMVGYTDRVGESEGFIDGGGKFRTPKNGPNHFVYGINAHGSFVGAGGDGGFVYANGKYEYVKPAPCTKSSNVYVTAINVHGDIVGYCRAQAGGVTGFARIAGVDQAISAFSSDTFPTGINDSGLIVGYFSSDDSGYPAHGFLYSAGTATQWDFSPGGSYNNTQILGVNNRGSLVGITYDGTQDIWYPFYAIVN